MKRLLSPKPFALAMLGASALAACSTAPMASAQTPPSNWNSPPMSSIQPETTITLTGKGKVRSCAGHRQHFCRREFEAETASAR